MIVYLSGPHIIGTLPTHGCRAAGKIQRKCHISLTGLLLFLGKIMAGERLAILFQICTHSANAAYKLLLIYISIERN